MRTQFGLHIIKVCEVKEPQTADFEQVRAEIREELVASRRESSFKAWLDQQRKAARIELLERR